MNLNQRLARGNGGELMLLTGKKSRYGISVMINQELILHCTAKDAAVLSGENVCS